ncbi:MAG: prepilin-type N-terminal cleavage/methylation domain-containing protein [Xanthomonadales bacterium]|jgi:type IV pilus assembly protein PilV|nr:prepilin-type N-terminal cleavage/methylation domain-containing protein [Xanthomonadales bacterium]
MRLIHRPGHGGFSLIELTVAVAIFSTGIGSFSLLLLLALQGTVESRLHSIAVSQVRCLTESVELLPTVAGDFPRTSSPQACLAGSVCTPVPMAAATLQRWQVQLAREIPGGRGTLCRDSTPFDGSVRDARCDGAGHGVVKVFWLEPGANGQEAGDRRVVARLPLL